jgi:hypothetical protein
VHLTLQGAHHSCSLFLQGTLKIWRVEKKTLAVWPPEKYGHFFAGDCYLLLYNYKDAERAPRSIIYIWQVGA